jgi:hypothetical protein
MKKLDSVTLGVEEMSDAQMQEVDGGIFHLIAAAIIGGMIYDLVNNTSECGDAFSAGWAAARN